MERGPKAEITVFKAGIHGVPIAELTLSSRSLRLAALGLGAIGLVIAGKAGYDALPSMEPTYVLKGNPAPPMDDKPEWVRPTDWKKK